MIALIPFQCCMQAQFTFSPQMENVFIPNFDIFYTDNCFFYKKNVAFYKNSG